MKKCVLLCSNCHGELHSSRCETKLPEQYTILTDEVIVGLIDGTSNFIPKTPCPVCQTMKPEWHMTCSPKCGYKLAAGRKIDWNSIPNLLELYKEKSAEDIGTEIGCSVSAVMRRLNVVYGKELITQIRNNRGG